MQESEIDINTPLSPDNSAVLKHIDMYQGIIDRMASNSSACKNWCIVLVSAFLAFIVKDGHYDIAWIVSVPIIIFCFLDSYYLGLEQQFRDAFKASTKCKVSLDYKAPPFQNSYALSQARTLLNDLYDLRDLTE